jgi:hypothetical protein
MANLNLLVDSRMQAQWDTGGWMTLGNASLRTLGRDLFQKFLPEMESQLKARLTTVKLREE